MAMIPEEEIERIKRETDLAAVVRSRGIELKRQGGDLIGRCPFHQPDNHPSMHVTPATRLWRCVSCQATGNVIQFVQRFDGVSFRHAALLLQAALDVGGAALPTPPRAGAPVKKSTVPKLASPLAVDADDQAALRQVLDYYHARLRENPAALAYLQKRGIANEEALTMFRLGFVDRTLGLRLPQKNRAAGAAIRERLARLGVMRETGHEHFRGRVVFPVIAEDGVIGTIYGRAVGKVEKPDRHLFLPGPQCGVWNPAALRAPEVILTEGIIDALTFWCAGFRHVTTCFSARQPSEDVLAALLAAKVQRVLLAFNRDRAGDTGTDGAASRLAAHGIECLRVMFPPGHDANSYALSVTPPEKSLGLLLRSAVPLDGSRRLVSPPASRAPVSSLAAKAADAATRPGAAENTNTPPLTTPKQAAKEEAAAEDTAAPTLIAATKPNDNATAAAAMPPPASSTSAVTITKNEPEEVVLLVGDREYRVRGLAKNSGIESLKVTLRVRVQEPCRAEARQSVGGWHMDGVDLCVARERERFINAAACETALKPELIKRDLGHVLFTLEQLQEQRLRAAVAPAKPGAPEIPAPLRERALALLRDPQLLDRILEAFAACGLVGEEINKLVGYLAATSRLMERPLAVIIQSTSAAGKTALMEAILAFFPPEARVKYSAMTGQALYYLGDADLKHKILAIVEEEGAERASYALKLLQSEGELCIASTGKDPHTGRMVTQEYRVEGR